MNKQRFTILVLLISLAIVPALSIVRISVASPLVPALDSVAEARVSVMGYHVYLPVVSKRWPPIPYTPVLNPIPDGNGNYTVDWDNAELAENYTLEEDDNAAFSSPVTRYAGSSTSWNAVGKATGRYYYRVKAINSVGESGWSNTQSVVVRLPNIPGLNPINNPEGDGDYTVSWNTLSDATNYILHEDDNAAFSSPVLRYVGPNTSWNASGKAAGTYYYRVKARNSVGDSGWSNIRSVVVRPPNTPGLNPINNSDRDGNYTVSWNTMSGATIYILHEDDNAAFSSPVIRYAGPSTSWNASGKATGTHYYRVKARNTVGDSDWSNVRSVSVLPSRINASEDTTIIQGYPTLNACNTVDMWAGYDDYYNPDGKVVRSLIKFNVSSIPPGTAISQVTLNVKLFGYYDYPNRSRAITTYRVGSAWSACNTTWKNKPTIANAYGSQRVAQDLGSWYTFDVTGLVRGWVNGVFANFGVWLRGPEASGSDSSWRAFYTQNSSYDPYLSLTYPGLSGAEQTIIFESDEKAPESTSSVIEKLNKPFPTNSCQSSPVGDQKCLNVLRYAD